MSGYGAFAFVGAALMCWFGFGWFKHRRNQIRLASVRPGMTQESFLLALCSRGISQDVATDIYQWIAAYYGKDATC